MRDRSAVLSIAVATLCLGANCPRVDPSGYLEEVEDLGPILTCLPVGGGESAEHDVAAMRERGAIASLNERGYHEAAFDAGHDFVYVPPGPFQMGTDDWGPDERPAHSVTLSGFWIGKNLVTNDQFRAFVDETGFVTDAEKPGADGCYIFRREARGGTWVPTPGRNWTNPFRDHPTEDYYRDAGNLGAHPVGCVSWYDAAAFAEWLSERIGVGVGLPTEAQWEKAARGTDARAWPWGNVAPDGSRSNFADRRFDAAYPQPNQGVPDLGVDDGWSATSPIGSHPEGASPYGVLDLSGNTTQWVHDLLAPYPRSAIENPIGPGGGEDRSIRAMRGGFWNAAPGSLTPTAEEIREKHNTRADLRAGDDPRSSDDHLGFRVAIDYCVRRH